MNIRSSFLTRIGFVSVVISCFSALGMAHAQHPLESWVRRTVPGPNSPLNSIAYGNGVFVAVGENSFVARSTDGATWTTSTAGSFGNLMRVRFLNGQFLAVGSSDKVLFSTDGASWTSSTLPIANFWDVAWGNGAFVLAGPSTYVSSDGVNWTQTRAMTTYPLPFPPGGTSSYETIFDTMVFGNGVFLGLPTGSFSPLQFGPSKTFYSTNSVDWVSGGQALMSPRGSEGTCELLFADGVWLATMEDDFLAVHMGVTVSTNNSESWCCDFGSRYGAALSYGQGHYLWIQNNYASSPQRLSVYVSTNGFSWTYRFGETNESVAAARSAAFGNGTFVIVGAAESGSSYILQSGNISGEPIIFQQPQDRGAVAMNPASFTVQAVGASPMTYQWYKNGSSIANATNATFTIASVETGDIGGYHAVIGNSFGSVTSRVAQLTVAFLDINCYAGISVLGVPGRTYRIEASPAAGSPNWQTVTNLVLPQSPYVWIDYDSPNLPSRIYRASELP